MRFKETGPGGGDDRAASVAVLRELWGCWHLGKSCSLRACVHAYVRYGSLTVGVVGGGCATVAAVFRRVPRLNEDNQRAAWCEHQGGSKTNEVRRRAGSGLMISSTQQRIQAWAMRHCMHIRTHVLRTGTFQADVLQGLLQGMVRPNAPRLPLLLTKLRILALMLVRASLRAEEMPPTVLESSLRKCAKGQTRSRYVSGCPGMQLPKVIAGATHQADMLGSRAVATGSPGSV